MFDAPFHDAEIVVKAFVRQSPGAGEPRTCRRLCVEARGVCFDVEKRFDVFVRLDAELTRGNVCVPETRRQRAVIGKFRISFDKILFDALDISACVDPGKTGDLFACQLKHAGVLPAICRSLRRASQMSRRRTACAA